MGFRWFVREAARELDLAGWVKNREDGGMEVVAEGTLGALESLRSRLRDGPGGGAKVTEIEEVMANADELARPFTILR